MFMSTYKKLVESTEEERKTIIKLGMELDPDGMVYESVDKMLYMVTVATEVDGVYFYNLTKISETGRGKRYKDKSFNVFSLADMLINDGFTPVLLNIDSTHCKKVPSIRRVEH